MTTRSKPSARSSTSSRLRSSGGASISVAAGNERRGLRQPGRIPERADLAPRLVARARAAVEALVGGRVQEERLHGAPASRRPRATAEVLRAIRRLHRVGERWAGRDRPGRGSAARSSRRWRGPRRSARARRAEDRHQTPHERAAHRAMRARLGAPRRAQRAGARAAAWPAPAMRSELFGRVGDVADLVAVDLPQQLRRVGILGERSDQALPSPRRPALLRPCCRRRR